VKLTYAALTLLTVAGIYGQINGPEPQLSAAEKTAIQALENQKKQAQEQFLAAQNQESVIEREFSTSHPGWHINAQSLVVEKNAPTPEKKP
jgi:cysteinyl-tRNA synthetase